MSTIVNPTSGLPFATQTALGAATTRAKLCAIAQCGTTAGAVTVQRPTPRVQGSMFAVVDSDGNAATNNITVDGDGDLIDGAATVTISNANGAGIFLYDAGQWRRLVLRRAVNGFAALLDFRADSPPSAPTIASILGARLWRWYSGYTAGGTWTDVVSGANATQAVAAQRPAVGLTSKGFSFPIFDGTNDWLLSGPLSLLPAWATGQSAIWGANLLTSRDSSWIWDTVEATPSPQWILYCNAAGLYFLAGATSNGALNDGVMRQVILVRAATTGVCTLYVNKVAQAVTSVTDFGSDWKTTTSIKIGVRTDEASFFYQGRQDSPFWGLDPAGGDFSPLVGALSDALLARL